ncbi:MAG: GTP-binding protein [gamma proteobacterium symbiont of Bathyaustriella thionipta]|nr:GTP-binding protein [gamma proteobacterium symbiont of Bathyaustriella thionipta]MCU7951653.1 GTP-binding protein [gamma proteobacterium symbiont of Bathyaustriella thionipta]MCU7958286.1 GTP-binding protein [gamma proteobacterium symbiont of Bathyaustriella thionipta]MCU7967373.1 GTP-binding protein [gamma proteobacterium symbiont of Bathyaustriella thionipta]
MLNSYFFQSYTIPKEYINSIKFGRFSNELLDIERNNKRGVTFPDAHTLDAEKMVTHSHNHHHQDSVNEDVQDLTPPLQADNDFSWQRFENNGQGYYGCGWIFNRSIVFDELKLEKFITGDTFSRVKGIFHTNNDWLLFNRSEQQFTKQKLQQNADSRVEIIEPDYHDWNRVEEQLLACIYSD